MTKLARLPANDRAPKRVAAPLRRARRLKSRYYAFLSYSHKDEEIADWLHSELEDFRVPPALAGKLTENGVVPKRLTPVFRDEHELAAADDLGEEIEQALASSQFLIVLCSPDAARSHWTNAEIELFKRNRPEGCVLAAIASGEPFASEMAGREDEECFPPALRQRFDRRGRPTGRRAEPLAADLRESGDGRRMGFLKLVAGMLGVGLDDLIQRDTIRRHRRMAWLAAASLAGMAVTSTLAFTAIQARDSARDQRREAEGLVAFMLGDLKDKLEPIGRLDALDGVGSRVLAYYQKQTKSDLSDASLIQRSRALSLMGQVAYLRGNMDSAIRLYGEALAGTEEAVRRDPSDAQRLFDQSQNVFWLGAIAGEQGDLKRAETSYRDYKTLAAKMVALAPDNMKWRMEEQYADENLGIVLYKQRRFAEAAGQLVQALQTIEALARADPRNAEYQRSVSLTLAWLADARMSEGRLADATALRQRQLALLATYIAQQPGDVSFPQMVIPAEQGLGRLYAMQGRRDLALEHFGTSVRQAERLLAVEPNNTVWLESAFQTRLALAGAALSDRQPDEAATQTANACAIVSGLLRRDSRFPQWRAGQRDCEAMRTRLALANGASDEAATHAERAVAIARSVGSSDPIADRFGLATAYRLLGDSRRAIGDDAAARGAWEAALAALPADAAERASETSERVLILQRLGRRAEAAQLASRLETIGYRKVV
jgi:tetratricopeptide (TPR) repeat protein